MKVQSQYERSRELLRSWRKKELTPCLLVDLQFALETFKRYGDVDLEEGARLAISSAKETLSKIDRLTVLLERFLHKKSKGTFEPPPELRDVALEVAYRMSGRWEIEIIGSRVKGSPVTMVIKRKKKKREKK